jgi:hypothetical protein
MTYVCTSPNMNLVPSNASLYGNFTYELSLDSPHNFVAHATTIFSFVLSFVAYFSHP